MSHAWSLEESDPTFLVKAEEYLRAVPGNSSWKELLARYVRFERLVPSVSHFMLHPIFSKANEWPGRNSLHLLTSRAGWVVVSQWAS